MTTKRTWRSTAVITIAAALVSGCLDKDERHVWYLDPASGSVSWVVFEHDVRSDQQDSAKRLAEEAGYRRNVLAETHGAARGFRLLRGSKLRTVVVRNEVPFSIVTDARFPSIDELGRRLVAQFNAVGTSTVERDGKSFIWTWKAREGGDASDPPSDDDLDGFFFSLFQSLQVVLPTGHFESAVGFTLDEKSRVATIVKEQFNDVEKDTEMVLSLRWTPAPS